MSVLDGFFSTWSNAKATFGEGTPQTGDQFDGSPALSEAQSTLDSAAPGSWWTGGAASAYGAANTNHQRVIGEIGALDKTLAAQVNKSAEVVANGRTQLDAVRQWVVDAAASVPPGKNRDQLLLPIANKGVGDVMGIVQKTNSELGTIGNTIQGLTGKYDKLAGETFTPKEDKPEIQGVKGDEENKDEAEKRAEEDVKKTLAGDPAAAARVDEVLRGVKPYETLSPEEAAYLHQMQVQQKDMSIQDIHAAEQKLGDHKNVIGDSWQLMSNDDVKYDDPDHPGQQITGSRDQLPEHVKTMMTLGTIADDFNRTGETEVRDMSQILKDGRVELQTGTEVDRGMIELSDRLMDNPSPTNEQAVRDIFDSAGRDHQIITDQLLGRNEGGRDGFLEDINSMDWRDDGKSAGNLFNWTNEAVGTPEAGIASQAAEQYAEYIGKHPELLHMPGLGADQTLGQYNPELVKAYAHGLTPYMADIASVSGGAADDFEPLESDSTRPLAKNIFAVLGTDVAAYREFNTAANKLALENSYEWANAVKDHEQVFANDERMSAAATLKGLIDHGTAEGLAAIGMHQDQMIDLKKSVYSEAVGALSAAGGPYGKAIGMFGGALGDSFFGNGSDISGDVKPMFADESARFATNALLAVGVDVPGTDKYLVPNKDMFGNVILDEAGQPTTRLGNLAELRKINLSMTDDAYGGLLNQKIEEIVGVGRNPAGPFGDQYEDVTR